MSTTIEWTDETWNPVVGCSRVSAGCRNCYAFRSHDMRHAAYKAGKALPAQYAKPFTTIQTMPDRLNTPVGWRRPRKVFVNSVSDLFHEDVPFDFILAVWGVMAATPHTYQVLTKRARRMLAFFEWMKEGMRERGLDEWEKGPEVLRNVWLGVSVEGQRAADERIPLLLQTPAAVRFLSCEPLLGPVDLTRIYDVQCDKVIQWVDMLDWVICGGESGAGARPMHPDWARSLRDQCQAAGVPFFFKQWGEWVPASNSPDESLSAIGKVIRHRPQEAHAWGDGTHAFKVGKKAAGRLLDGLGWYEFPRDPRCKCFADRGLLMTANCTLHGEAED